MVAAVIRKIDGELLAMPPASWRRGFLRPADEPWSSAGISLNVPLEPFAEAAAGRDVPAMTDSAGNPNCWGKPIIAEHDLTEWFGDRKLAAEPFLRPTKWPAATSSPVSLEAAIEWMRNNGRDIRKADEPDCMAAVGCSRDAARKAATIVFGPAKMGRPKK